MCALPPYDGRINVQGTLAIVSWTPVMAGTLTAGEAAKSALTEPRSTPRLYWAPVFLASASLVHQVRAWSSSGWWPDAAGPYLKGTVTGPGRGR